MSKRKERRERQELFDSVTRAVRPSVPPPATDADEDDAPGHDTAPISDDVLRASPVLSRVLTHDPNARRELTKMKKFRFQLLHGWMQANLAPCRVADIGGGKGLLAYLLNQSGWDATTIDPIHQELPPKYKDIGADRQVKIAPGVTVPRLDDVFAPYMAEQFDLLVAMHAHGCNVQLIDAAADFGRSFLVLPCCIINEPLRPPQGTHWLQCVADYARGKGFEVEPFRLNFKGQNIGLYASAKTKAEEPQP